MRIGPVTGKRGAAAVILVAALSLAAHARERPQDLWATLKNVSSIPEGAGPRVLYIFFDPNCPYCHKLYNSLRPLLRPNDLRISWIPVGILTLSSYGKAAALLRASNPTLAMAQDERTFHRGQGGIRPRRATPIVKRELRRNVAALDEAGADGVPFLVYKGQSGRVRTVIGDPPKAALLRILNHIKQRIKERPQKAKPQKPDTRG